MVDQTNNNEAEPRSKGRISRREFIKYTTAAVAGLSVPLRALDAWDWETGIDTGGGLITAVKLDPLRAYAGDYEIHSDNAAAIHVQGICDQLTAFIQGGETDDALWQSIVARIDYIYQCLDDVLIPILGSVKDAGGTGGCKESRPSSSVLGLTLAGRKIVQEVHKHGGRTGKKLFFKPNVEHGQVIGVVPGNSAAPLNNYKLPGAGVVADTDWSFLAALMRWFHDHLEISYHRMAVGEDIPTARAYSEWISLVLKLSGDFKFSPEALFEGRLTDPQTGAALNYGGYPFYFVRKYLAATHDSRHSDDPLAGHLQSIAGAYASPGRATDRLMVYNLNATEENLPHENRGRRIPVPNGAVFNEITLHKALIGDPDDLENYPGCVLINVPRLKVHSVSPVSHAIKNLGFGLLPSEAGEDNDPKTPDYLYGWPSSRQAMADCGSTAVPGIKAGAPTTPWSQGVKFNCDGATDPQSRPTTPNHGHKGTMVDVFLALKAQKEMVPYMLHVSDGVAAANLETDGNPRGYLNNEGLILACEDPVALDLFAARYLFKNVPQKTVTDHPFAMYTPGGDVRFDPESFAIVSSDGGYEWPVEETQLFQYAESKGIGKQLYHVRGEDLTSAAGRCVLVSRKGHLGRLHCSAETASQRWQDIIKAAEATFEEVLTTAKYDIYGYMSHYWCTANALQTLQNMFFNLARANDELTRLALNYNPGYEQHLNDLDRNADGRLQYADEANEIDKYLGIAAMSLIHTAAGQTGGYAFHDNAKRAKYSIASWNELGAEMNESSAMVTAYYMAMSPPPKEGGGDPFFKIPYGRTPDGKSCWPSLQFAKFAGHLNQLKTAYKGASDYAVEKGYTFTMYVPQTLPYFPLVQQPFLRLGSNSDLCSNVVQTDDPQRICTAEFFDQNGRIVETW